MLGKRPDALPIFFRNVRSASGGRGDPASAVSTESNQSVHVPRMSMFLAGAALKKALQETGLNLHERETKSCAPCIIDMLCKRAAFV